jgi:large subunit ribosomal protein L30
MDNEKTQQKKELTVVIRIAGMVKKKSEIVNTLDRLRLRRKYACTIIDSKKKEMLGMLEKVKHYVAYGQISNETLEKLIKARGQSMDKKEIDAGKVVEGLLKGKPLKDLGLKPFFRLHPPRKGIKSKLQYPKGVLGDNKKDINKLIERML